MKKQRQKVRSTKIRAYLCNFKKQNIIVKVFNMDATVCTNQTGCFPMQSSRGNTSMMVMFDVDANHIDAEPIRNHHNNQMIPAYQHLWKRVSCGCTEKPKLHILDNEASACSWCHLTLTIEI